MEIEQGDIIAVERLKGYYLVTSTKFFNKTEQAILCPIVQDTFLDIPIETDEVQGIVMCEQMRLVDLRYRDFKRVTRVHYPEIIDITDAIQSIFDY